MARKRTVSLGISGLGTSVPDRRVRVKIVVRVDELLLEEMKKYQIWPTAVCIAAIRREIRKRKELELAKQRELDPDLPLGYRSD